MKTYVQGRMIKIRIMWQFNTTMLIAIGAIVLNGMICGCVAVGGNNTSYDSGFRNSKWDLFAERKGDSYDDDSMPTNMSEILPEFRRLWKSLQGREAKRRELVDELVRGADIQYQEHEKKLLEAIQDVVEQMKLTLKNPKLELQKETPGSNRTCFEQNLSILKERIKDCYAQEIKPSCLRDVKKKADPNKISKNQAWMNTIKNLRPNDTEEIQAFKHMYNKWFWGLKPNLREPKFNVTGNHFGELDVVVECFRVANSLLVSYVQTENALTDCRAGNGIDIDAAKKKQIQGEIEKLWAR